jgi:hypothetical protein
LTFFAPFVVALPFALPLPPSFRAVSSRTSSRTRRRRAGNVVISPERSSERAYDWMVAGQLEELALREWRRES